MLTTLLGQIDPLSAPGDSASSLAKAGLLALVIGVGLLVLITIIRRLLFIARPNEVLIVTGRRGASGLGYRVVTGGSRALRIPVLQEVHRIDMRLIPTYVAVKDAYSQGNIPLEIHAIANVKIHSDPRYLPNAVERLLGKHSGEVQAMAQQTLEGALREAVAQLTPEDVNQDRLKFAKSIIDTAEDDLCKLGLQLDTLKIQNVSDSTNYLNSLGRPQIAAVKRDAENAEAEAMQEITRAQATAHQFAEVAKAQAETQTLQKKNELRRVIAELDGEASAIEREAEAAAKTARAQAEQELQSVRADLENKRLQADVVIPADTNRKARQIDAVGEAAPIVENGAAAVEVLKHMTESWRSMGSQAKEIYVIQHLDQIIETVAQHLRGVQVAEVNVLDPGDGSGLSGYAATYPQMIAAVLRAVNASTGIDIPAILNSSSGDGPSAPRPPGAVSASGLHGGRA